MKYKTLCRLDVITKTRLTVMAVFAFSLSSVAESALPPVKPKQPISLETVMPAAPSEDRPRDLNTPHLFTPPATRASWEARKKCLREQILFSAGLLPMPKKTPLKPRTTGRIEGPDYIIENVALETWPGFYLCGNLYLPKGKTGPFPAIANPHGHWANGRLEIEEDVPIAAPAPGKAGAGRANLVSIGVNLARQGFAVFAYDMVGYNDTTQVNHRFANGLRPWLWNISLAGLQLWNSIRVVDYLCSRKEVDRSRIGVTGASGGGTQTFLLCAVDDRIKAAVPVNMVSATMQGGCLCENGPGLRVGNDNPEVAAMLAPKPLLLVAATGDWTKDNPQQEWPAIKKVYDLYDAGDKTAVRQFNYGHNYNMESREAMYAWFGKHLLHDSNSEHFREKPFEADVKAMRVWSAKTPMPVDALTETNLIESFITSSEQQLSHLMPKDAASLRAFQKTMRPAFRHALALYGSIDEKTLKGEIQAGAGKRGAGSALIVYVDSESERFSALKTALERKGVRVTGLSLPPMKQNADQLWKDFYSGYNRTLLGDRVQAILDQIAAMKTRRLAVIGLGSAGLWTLLARGMADISGRVVADTEGFKSAEDKAYLQTLYAPGLRRAGDIRAAAILCASEGLCLMNTKGDFQTDVIAATYDTLHTPLRLEKGALSPADIATWLTEGR